MYCLLAASLLAFAGCFSTSKVSTPSRNVVFDYTPPTTAAPKSSNISFILLKPGFAPQFQYSQEKLFQDFVRYMAADFNEMVIARGFTLRGEPYDTYDEIVYSDKAEADLILHAEVDISITPGTNTWKKSYNALTKSYVYYIDGMVSLGGKITLTASETLTREKLWTKSISLAPREIYAKSQYRYTGTNILISNDVGLYNPISEAMEDYYKKALSTAWTYLEPMELQPLKAQVEALRKKKTY